MWGGRTIAVVFPTYREAASIRGVIQDFEALGVVDDLVVVNNNAEPGTSEEVAATGAREVHEPRQGYGSAIRRGIAETDADLICIVEPDGTFSADDLWKLLAYATEFDFVYGSRTVRDFIWDGANMGRFLRWGNWAVAKYIELAFNTGSLSDVGCTMRLVNGDAVRSLLPHFTVYDGAFGPEMLLLSVIGGWRTVQIPVNYRAREGRPGTTSSFGGAFTIGVQMIALISSYRLRQARVRRRLERGGINRGPRPEPSPGGEPAHMFPQLRLRSAPRRSR
jgi:glycosyltransferase involved in cell wall biosynthesis